MDGENRTAYDAQTCIPVTIRMILNAVYESEQSDVSLQDGRTATTVRFVGAVRSVEEQSTNVCFQVEDGTGLIDVKQWYDQADCESVTEQRIQASQENCYIRVVGQIKVFQGSVSVMGYNIRRLKSSNEITHHFLEVIYSAEKYKQKQSNTTSGTNSMHNSGHGNTAPNHIQSAGGNYGRPVMQQTASYSTNNAINDAVLNFIKQDTSKEGADIRILISNNRNFSEKQVREKVEELASNGLIYSTINENHWNDIA